MEITKITSSLKRSEQTAEHEYIALGPRPLDRLDRERRDQASIQRFYDEHHRMPGRNELVRTVRMNKTQATQAITLFQRNQDRLSQQIAYIDRFNSLLKQHSEKFVAGVQKKGKIAASLHRLQSFISPETKKQLDQGLFALFDHHAGKLLHLILTVPSDSEIACLAVCLNSEDVVLWFLKNIGIHPEESFHLSRWDFHEDRKSNRAHVHIVLADERKILHHNFKSMVRRAWLQTLDHLDSETFCNPFFGEDGLDYRDRGNWIDVVFDYKEFVVNEFYTGYFSKTQKNGVWLSSYKKLSILNDARVSPKCHGGVSPALAQLISDQSARAEIHVRGIITAMDLALELTEKLPLPDPNHPWKEYGRPNCSYMIGWQCRYLPEQLDLVAQNVKALGEKYPTTPGLAQVVITITPDRVCKIHHRSLIKNFGGEKVEAKLAHSPLDLNLHATGKRIYEEGIGNKQLRNLLASDIKPLAYFLHCGDQDSNVRPHITDKAIVTGILKALGSQQKHALSADVFYLAIKAATSARYHKVPRRF